MQFDKKINRFLAEWVSVINALVAIGIPSVTALVTAAFAGSGPFTRDFSFLGFLGGLVFGGAAGVLIAGTLCGVLATLIDIRNSLARQGRRLTDSTKAANQKHGTGGLSPEVKRLQAGGRAGNSDNAFGARLSDTEATETIGENTGLMPAALLARFGRATAEQLVEQIERRIAAPARAGMDQSAGRPERSRLD